MFGISGKRPIPYEKMPRAVISRQFLELQPSKPEEVRQIWIFVHILCLALASFSGWVAAYAFGQYQENFDFRCPLFAKLLVVTEKSLKKQNLSIFSDISLWNEALRQGEEQPIDIKKSRWGDAKLCNFVQFQHVASMLSCIIWIVFFAISGSGSRIRGQIIGKPHRLILPFLGWCIMSCLVVFASNSTLAGGLNHFCSEFESPDGTRDTEICFGAHLESYRIFFGNQHGKGMFVLFIITKVAGYAELIFWAINVLWTCLRIYLNIDYRLYLITVWRYEISPSRRSTKVVAFQEPETR